MKITGWKKEEPVLLVPMYIEAMVCGKEDNSDYADIRFQYHTLVEKPSGKALETEPFSMKPKYDPGVYIHWLLPEGFTHGIQYQEGEEPVYPCIPNRYLITRLVTKTTGGEPPSIMRKEWVVESDLLLTPPKKTMDAVKMAKKHSAVAYAFDTKMPYRYMGTVREYDAYGNFTTEHATHQKLTAVCSGNPLYTAYYPMCKNVFSFYDKLDDVKLDHVELTYIVSGWYEESTDPFFDTQKKPEEIEEELFFKWNGMQENQERRHIVCHGVVSEIEWRGVNILYPTGLSKSALKPSVVMGYSSSEALATYICHSNKKPELERVLEGLLEGVLDQWEKTDGYLLAQQQLFQYFFHVNTAIDEMIWHEKEIVPDEQTQNILEEINQKRRMLEKMEMNVHRLRQEGYLTWCRAIDHQCTEEEALRKIENHLNNIGMINAEMKVLQWNIANMEKQLNRSSVQDIPGQNYWEPNDIVVLLEGEGLGSIYKRLKKKQEDEKLLCRTEKEFVTELCLEQVEKEGKEQEIRKVIATDFLPAAKVILPDILEQIVRESSLQAKSCQKYLLLTLKQKYSLSYIQIAGPIAVHQWKPDWNPLFLEWEVEYIPDPELQGNQYTFQNWKLTDNGYICQNPEIYQDAKERECYSGRSILSPHALLNLEEQLKNFMGTPCRPLLERLGSAKILSQYLDGFNQQLLGRKNSAVATVWEGGGTECLNQRAKELVGNEPVYRQTEKKIYPLRAGCVHIKKMQIVDSFGRVLEYEPDHVMIPERGKIKENDMDMLLVPQILAPVRIRTEWIYNKVENRFSPVYGFLWANLFDSCLHIYTPQGTLAGSLQIIYSLKEKGKCQIAFRNPPGEVGKEKELLEELPKPLGNFVQALYEKAQKNPQILYELLYAIDKGIWNTNPMENKKDHTLLAGLGCPVVLSGMRFCVEGKEKSDCFLERLKFPVRVGNHLIKGDGTIGYYMIDGKNDYQTLYLTSDEGIQNEYMKYQSGVQCSFFQEKELTLLFLPTQSVYLTTGLIPVKKIQLPPEQLEDALKKIYMTLYYGPFLTKREELELIVPKALEKEWSFIHYDAPGNVIEEKNFVHPSIQAVQAKQCYEIYEGWLKLMAQKEDEENDGSQ